ncbi:hypothetical protein [Tabrizicola soli]|uniref:Uncharacterized protein n=1 Tax=Tabrizicola soli TaxID=2185115 RepID=A0ABV7DV05_9RHOB|nr:hypothetical protein [Tabrizicola soli]
MAFPAAGQGGRIILHLQNATQRRMNSTKARKHPEKDEKIVTPAMQRLHCGLVRASVALHSQQD